MADYRRTATGNWSTLAQWQEWNGTTWVAAVALPGAADRCFANNFTTTLDSPATITVAELNNSNSGPAGLTAGGTFTFGVTTTVNANGITAGTANALLSNATGGDRYINGTFSNNGISATSSCINGSNIIFNGTITAGGGSFAYGAAIGSNCNFTGVFNGGAGGQSYGILIVGAGINNIINGFSNGNNSEGIYLTTGSVVFNGVASGGGGGNGNGLRVDGGGNAIINGDCVGGTLPEGARNTSTGTLIVNGRCIASNGAAGISSNNAAGTTVVQECISAPNGRLPILGFIKFSNAGPNSIQVVKQDNTTQLLTDNSTVNYPVEADVRNLVQYGPGNIYTGTLVPDITPQDIFTAIANSSDPIAVRLRNVATVQTTGDQIAAAL